LFEDAVVFRVGSEGGGYAGAVEDGLTHVDSDGVVRVHYGDDGTSEGVDSVRFGIFTQILQKSSETTNSIAAHFEFRSVTVVDSHGEVEISLFWSFESKYDSISTNAKVAIA